MKIAFFTQSFKVQDNMKGIGYRCWEISNVLADYFEVTLFVPNEVDELLNSKKNSKLTITKRPDISALDDYIKEFDVFILESWEDPQLVDKLIQLDRVIITDSLISPVELLMVQKVKNDPNRDLLFSDILRSYSKQLVHSDSIIVGSFEEKLIILGVLTTLGRVNFFTFESDPELNDLVSIVPPGYSKNYNETVLFEHTSSKESNTLRLLWNGGLWNHYSPNLLIDVVGELNASGLPTSLLFMYTAMNTPTDVAKSAIEFAKEKNVLNKFIFFNDGQVLFHNREPYLNDSDAIAVFYDKSIDALTSLRLRFRDSLLFGKPIFVTNYGMLAELVNKEKIGVTVDMHDKNSLIDELPRLKTNSAFYKNNIDRIKDPLIYENSLKSLICFIKNGKRSSDRALWASN